MAHYDYWTLPLGYVMDLYAVGLNEVFFQIANHSESIPQLPLVTAI